MIFPSPKLQNLVWCYSFTCIWRPNKGCCLFICKMPLPLALTWGSWSQTSEFKPNTSTSYFQWCGCASPEHAISTMKIQCRLKYGAVPHIWTSINSMSSSYPWGSPMLCSNTYIGWGIQLPLFFICDALFQYASWWTCPVLLLQYRRTYGWIYLGIIRADFLLNLLEKTCSPISHWT